VPKKGTATSALGAVECTLRILLAEGLQVLSASDGAAAVTGYSPDDFLQARVSLASRIHADDRRLTRDLFSASGGSLAGSMNIRFRHADQRIRCLRANYRKLARASGLVLELDLADVCNLKTGIGEPALTDDFLAILENSEDCLYFKDRRQVFTAASQRLAVGAGTLEHWTQLIGKTDYEIFPEVYADRRYRQERKILAGGPPLHEIQEIPAASGRRCRWVESRKYPIRGPGGEIVGVAGIDRDITDLREAAAAQGLYKGRYDRLVDNLSPGYMFYANDRQGIFTFVSASVTAMLGWEPEEFLTHYSELVTDHPINREIDRSNAAALAGRRQPPFLIVARHKHGGERYLEIDEFPVFDEQGQVVGIEGIAHDVSERVATEAKLELAASVFSSTRKGIIITDAAGIIIEVNDSFTRITGYASDEVVGHRPAMFRTSRHRPEFYAEMNRCIVDVGLWHGEVWSRRKGGELFLAALAVSAVRDNDGSIHHCVALFSDITVAKAHLRQLESDAYHDVLTRLPNRALLGDRLRHSIAQAQRRRQVLAVVYLDLDGFKAINDQHGHAAGDQVLATVASRMQEILREGDTLARLGGDEFVAVLIDLPDTNACLPLLTRLLAAAAQPVAVDEFVLQISASAGVTFYHPLENIDADQLLRQADQAMYQAKVSGKNRYLAFDVHQDRQARSDHENLKRIHQALADNEFVLHYQPKINLRTRAVIGVEALIRWQHPERGLLLPALFLPAIANHPLAIDLGEWVIRTTLAQIADWQAAGLKVLASVNLGARHLQQANFVERLSALLAAQPQIGHGSLELELLESSVRDDLARVCRVIEACQEIGVTFSLDDFGTGYSSLTYLKQLPVSWLKIDHSFVCGAFDDHDQLAILEGILGLAAAFRRPIIAEGAQTPAHCNLLRQLGCELAQGYGIAHPMPADALLGWWTAWQADLSSATPALAAPEDAGLLLVRVEHNGWIAAVEKFLRGEREAAPSLDHQQCRLGRWLTGEGGGDSPGGPLAAQASALHQQMHHLADELVTLYLHGGKAEALARLGELHALRDAVFEQSPALLQD
jgi:diguanylate cyclase (GGDEF)-like protein/PAS domain S-box-containing protein